MGPSLLEISRMLAAAEHTFELDVLDPELAPGRHAGEKVEVGDAVYLHRPFRVWVDLAERLGFRLATPRPATPPLIRLRFERLARTPEPDPTSPIDPTERYGAGSELTRTSKLEDPGFVIDFAEAIDRWQAGRSPLPAAPRILDLGVNTGDTLELLLAVRPDLRDTATLVGVDHSATALMVARRRFPGATFIQADLHRTLDLGPRFDLVIASAVLQSANLDDREILRRIVQHQLADKGAVILAVPNCRIVDGETVYGARMVNYRQPELGLLIKDVAFYRKYLQQHGCRVFVTGKNYVFVTAVPA